MPTEIKYRKHRKYRRPRFRLLTTHLIPTQIDGFDIQTPGGDVRLQPDGLLTILPGYWWDGPSGGVPKKGRHMLWSLAHDALYELLREDQVTGTAQREDFRLEADLLMYALMLRSGVQPNKARRWYWEVRDHGEAYTHYLNANVVRSYTYRDIEAGASLSRESPPSRPRDTEAVEVSPADDHLFLDLESLEDPDEGSSEDERMFPELSPPDDPSS